MVSVSISEIEDIVYKDVRLTQGSAPRFYIDGEEVDIWSDELSFYHTWTTIDYVRHSIKEAEKNGFDVFPEIVGKPLEKELVKNALFSGSPILFKGDRGFGKTTFSKAVTKLLPPKLLAVRDCRIHDDPVHPSCFSCKWKVTHLERVELSWVPRIWVRIPGDPMLTTRQLIGGVSIQKLREGFDIDHPEVFIPGRALKANRGVGYFDELGAIPSSLQTMLHELFEERQVTTSEGDIIPMRLDSIEIASTNPSNYRGTSAIKEPLLDRMEVIEIGPPETVEEEIEIALRNMYYTRRFGKRPPIPVWHQRILAQIVRVGRSNSKGKVQLTAELSCRATIKVFDHVYSKVERRGGTVPMLVDYGENYEMIRLALNGRVEFEFGSRMSKNDFINYLINEAMKAECKHVYDEYLPQENFDAFVKELRSLGEKVQGGWRINISPGLEAKASRLPLLSVVIKKMGAQDSETKLSALEVILNSLSLCSDVVSRVDHSYVVREAGERGEAAV
ncbi:MAG: ATPase [Thermoprotei archaeon]